MIGLSGCFLSARYNMLATVMKQHLPGGGMTPANRYQYVQDPDSGAIERSWYEDDPDSGPTVDTTLVIPCVVRGVLDGGIRVAGTTERFGDIYENVDWAHMRFPANYVVTQRDRIVKVRELKADGTPGQIIWKEEQIDGRPTVFEVRGVTPVVEGFSGKLIEYSALLERAEMQTVVA